MSKLFKRFLYYNLGIISRRDHEIALQKYWRYGKQQGRIEIWTDILMGRDVKETRINV